MDTLLIIANILGYLGLALLFIQVVFDTRHIFALFTTDTVFINKLHSYIGKYGMIFVFLHPIAEMFVRWENILWIFTPSFITETEFHITLGRFALVLTLIVWITSAIVRSKIKWRPWKYIHLLSYPILFFSFIHVKDIGTFYNDYLVLKFLWIFTFVIFLLASIYRLFVWAGMFKAKFKLIEKKLIGNDIILIKLAPINKILNSKIGQHFYLQTSKFKSEHPFTIIRNENGTLSFGIRRVAGFWDEVNNKQIGEEIFVDGPYGVFTKEAQNGNPKVIISAGIGATPFLDLVEHFGDNAYYINCNRSAEEIIERSLLQTKSGKYLDLIDPNRINADVIKNFVGENYQNLPYFVCGSPNFINFLKQEMAKLEIPKNKLYYEELGF